MEVALVLPAEVGVRTSLGIAANLAAGTVLNVFFAILCILCALTRALYLIIGVDVLA